MRVGIDIETFPFETGIQLPQPVCFSYCFDGGQPAILTGEEIEPFVATILCERDLQIVGHNIAFDFGCLATHYPSLSAPIIAAYEADRIWDTMIWCQLADYAIGRNAHRYGLGVCCDRFDIEHGDKESEWRAKYGELAGVPVAWWPAEARTYSLLDASSVLALAARLRPVPDVAAQSRWAYWLRLSSAYGLMTDAPKVEVWGERLIAKAADLRSRLGGFIRKDGTRDMATISTAVDAAYAGSPPRTPTGKPATDGTTCRDSGDPTLELYAEYTETVSAISRELPMLRHPFIHTRYDLAETGRTTSSAPNLQNWTIKSGSRQCVRPRDGMVYCIADYGKLELCCIAQLTNALGTGDYLGEAIRAGHDPHALMAGSILGCSLGDAYAHPQFKMARQSAKIVNFGLPGGMGPKSLAEYAWSLYRVRITEGEAARLRDKWRRQWPDVVRYQRKVGTLLEAHCATCGNPPVIPEDGICAECNGEILYGALDHYRSGRMRGGLSYTQGCNTLFQGLGSDVTKAAGWALTMAGYTIVAFVHDEYVVEVPERGACEAALDVARIMADVGRDWLPAAPASCAPVLATRWIKDDPAYDAAGALVVIDVDARPAKVA